LSVQLYHFPPSLGSQKARLALVEKGVFWQGISVDVGPSHENWEPWYIRLNPTGEVPTLVHGDAVLIDGKQILEYVDGYFEGPPLTPIAQGEEEAMDYWIDRARSYPLRELSYVVAPGLFAWLSGDYKRDRMRKLLQHERAHPELSERYWEKARDLAQLARQVHDPRTSRLLLERLSYLLDELEMHLATNGTEFIASDAYSLADVQWTVFLARLEMIGLSAMWKRGRAHINAYYHRVASRPSFHQADIWYYPQRQVLAKIMAPVVLPKVVLGAVVTGAAVGVAYMIYKRRQDARREAERQTLARRLMSNLQ